MEKQINEEKYNLKWNSHDSIIAYNVLEHLAGEDLCDVTLSCEGKFIKAHKLILSSSSRYFKELFQIHKDKNPVIIMTNIRFEFIQYIIDYMYRGEVKLLSSELEGILKVANDLQIKGLYGILNKSIQQLTNKNVQKPPEKNDELNKHQSCQEKPNIVGNRPCVSMSPVSVKIETQDEPQILRTRQKRNGDTEKKQGSVKNKKQNVESTSLPKKRKIAVVQKEKYVPKILRQIMPKQDKSMDASKPKDLPASPQVVKMQTDSQNVCPEVETKLLEPPTSPSQAEPNYPFLPYLVPLTRKDDRCVTPQDEIEPTNSPKVFSQIETYSSHMMITNNEANIDEKETRPLAVKLISAFMLFAEEQRPLVSLQYPGESIKQISLRLSNMWKILSNEQKDSFYEAASKKNEQIRKKMKK